jgi:hypothetical protein
VLPDNESDNGLPQRDEVAENQVFDVQVTFSIQAFGWIVYPKDDVSDRKHAPCMAFR